MSSYVQFNLGIIPLKGTFGALPFLEHLLRHRDQGHSEFKLQVAT
jgi:hypothetical protein